jgi:DNA-binding transcriptional LysR family regulator
MAHVNLDMDALRSLAIAQNLGGLGRAAEQLGRTPSAISLQMKRLQEQVRVPLFRPQGRRTVLTEQGHIALRYAHRMLALNDEMLDTLRGASLSGVVRVGFAQDFVETVLPQALMRFSSLYPLVRLEVKIDRNASLVSELDAGNLDIALTLGEPKRTGTRLGELTLCWIASPSLSVRPTEPLPLVLFDEPCVFRSCALDALDSVGRSWRIAMTSPSVSGLWAAVGGGLGITVRAKTGAPSHLDFALEDLPPLGTISVTLHCRTSAKAPSVRRFAEIIGELTSSHYNLNQTSERVPRASAGRETRIS